jgi:dynactin 1
MTNILGVVKSCATSTVAKDMKPGTSIWEAIGNAIGHLIEESTKLLHPMLEAENVLKSEPYLFPDCERF